MIFLFTGPANDESCLQLLEKSLPPRDCFRRSPISVQTDGGLPQSSLDLASLEPEDLSTDRWGLSRSSLELLPWNLVFWGRGPWQHFCCHGVVQSRSKANLRRECTQSTYRDQFRRQRFSALLILSTLSWPAHTWIIGICPLPANCHHCHLFHIQPYFSWSAICVNVSALIN